MLDLASVNSKLSWAEELLVALDAEVLAWYQKTPYTYITKVNEERTKVSVIAKVYHDPPIVRWSLMISDIFHNLRCALDHTIWAIAVHSAKNGIPLNDRISFPIWTIQPNADARSGFKELSGSVRAALDSVQPHNLPPDPRLPFHPLTILRDVDNSNKHKLLKFAISGVGMGDIKVTWRGTQQDPPERFINLEGIENGAEIVSFTFRAPQVDMKCEVKTLSAIIAMRYSQPSPNGTDCDDYAALLDIIIASVKDAIRVVTAAVV